MNGNLFSWYHDTCNRIKSQLPPSRPPLPFTVGEREYGGQQRTRQTDRQTASPYFHDDDDEEGEGD